MRKKKKSVPNRSIETLQTEAAKLLAAGHYKEAIDAYKRLLKKEPRQTWQSALAQAYLSRAVALAAKGMYKEATVLWENRANLCQDNELFDKYLYWLIQAGRNKRAARLFIESAALLPEEITWQLHAQFGALLLAGYQEIIEDFPEDAPLIKQYSRILKALHAYYQGDDKTTNKYVKQIPFRSPFRDFRVIVKALLVIETDPDAANQLLEKVPLDSPYAKFAELIRMATQHDDSLLESLSKISSPEQTLIAGFKGWDKAQFKVISMLQSAAKRDTNKALLEVVAANRQSLGDDYCQQFCLALLPSYPGGVKFYERTFKPLSEFDRNRITALNYERQGHSLRADRQWRLCVNYFKQHPQEENSSIKAALILRHLVELADQRGDTFEDNAVSNDLIESLQLEPDDKASYLNLIQWYDHQNNQKGYQKWVDAAIKQLPKDSDVLLIAMEAATRKKAFKKAAGFAKTLLKVDPINVKARQIARFSLLSHARKLIKSEKYTLARKELAQAASLEKTNQRSGVVQINQGLLELQAQGFIKPIIKRGTATKPASKNTSPAARLVKPKGKIAETPAVKLLQEGIQLTGGGILGRFRLIVESKSQNIEPKNLPLAQLDKHYLPTRHEILELISLINSYSEEGITFLTEAVEQLKEQLQKTIKLDFSQDETLSLCECLKKVKHYELLKQFADQAVKRWSKHPAFVFYQIYGKLKGSKSMWNIQPSDMARLQSAVDRAEEQGDKRTSMMIVGFLNQMEGGGLMPPHFGHPFGDMFDDDDEIEGELENIKDELEALENRDLDKLSPGELIKILNRLEDIGIEIPDFDLPIPRRKKKKR